MPDWYGITGRNNLVGGYYSVTIEGITLCADEPFTKDECEALREYFRRLRDETGKSSA